MNCDVCGADVILGDTGGVASSCLGPISFCFCLNCIHQNAEPHGMLETTYTMVDGEVADWVKQVRTYKNDKYMSWDEWLETVDGPALIKDFYADLEAEENAYRAAHPEYGSEA